MGNNPQDSEDKVIRDEEKALRKTASSARRYFEATSNRETITRFSAEERSFWHRISGNRGIFMEGSSKAPNTPSRRHSWEWSHPAILNQFLEDDRPHYFRQLYGDIDERQMESFSDLFSLPFVEFPGPVPPAFNTRSIVILSPDGHGSYYYHTENNETPWLCSEERHRLEIIDKLYRGEYHIRNAENLNRLLMGKLS